MSSNAVKERPILFSGPMVRAILDGRKTQTRRIVKASKRNSFAHFTKAIQHAQQTGIVSFEPGAFRFSGGDDEFIMSCPYGKAGDRLWVKETYRLPVCFDRDSPSEVGAKCVNAGYRSPWSPVRYEADGDDKFLEMLNDFGGSWGKTRVSIHMPRWASRITLEITGVRVERLNDIDADDVIAEGAVGADYEWWHVDSMVRQQFHFLWESINGVGSWGANPWVWVIEFKKL